MLEWLAMDGYAGFVWAAYGAAFSALAGFLGFAWRGYVQAEKMNQSLKKDPSHDHE